MKKHFPSLLILLLLGLGSLQSFAQFDNHLILKKGYKSKHHYLSGDEIRFKELHSHNPIIGPIDAIGEDFIAVNNTVYKLSDITTVFYLRKSFNYAAAGRILLLAGPGFLALSATNALIQAIRPIWSVSNLITGGTLVGLGLILPAFQQKDYVLGEKYFLRIVPADPELQKILH